MFHVQQATFSPLKRIRSHEEIRKIDSKNTVASAGKSGVGEKIYKSNEQKKNENKKEL